MRRRRGMKRRRGRRTKAAAAGGDDGKSEWSGMRGCGIMTAQSDPRESKYPCGDDDDDDDATAGGAGAGVVSAAAEAGSDEVTKPKGPPEIHPCLRGGGGEPDCRRGVARNWSSA
ncbi:hypothetical protein ABZP36_010174 [Zizania latifolia]